MQTDSVTKPKNVGGEAERSVSQLDKEAWPRLAADWIKLAEKTLSKNDGAGSAKSKAASVGGLFHFPFAFSPSAFVEPTSTMPKYIARLRIAAALRFSRTAIEPEVSPVAARTRS